jgi:hypothetical protein
MTGRAALVTAGAFALAMLGFAVVAKADEPSGPGGPTGPTPEDCDQMRAEKSNLQAQRAALNDQLIAYQEQALQAAQAGDSATASQATQAANATKAQMNAIDGAISELNRLLEDC